MEDLWGDLDFTSIKEKAPIVILKEQANLLSDKTKGLVIGVVIQYETEAINQLYYGFNLKSPLLSGYTYNLFDILHQIPTYPVVFKLEGTLAEEMNGITSGKDQPLKGRQLNISARDEKDLILCLRNILQSPTTINVIKSLVTQSQAFIKDAPNDEDIPF